MSRVGADEGGGLLDRRIENFTLVSCDLTPGQQGAQSRSEKSSGRSGVPTQDLLSTRSHLSSSHFVWTAIADGSHGTRRDAEPLHIRGTQQKLLRGSAHSHQSAGNHAVRFQPLKESRFPVRNTVDEELAVLLYQRVVWKPASTFSHSEPECSARGGGRIWGVMGTKEHRSAPAWRPHAVV